MRNRLLAIIERYRGCEESERSEESPLPALLSLSSLSSPSSQSHDDPAESHEPILAAMHARGWHWPEVLIAMGLRPDAGFYDLTREQRLRAWEAVNQRSAASVHRV
jgi:hypothetical protein